MIRLGVTTLGAALVLPAALFAQACVTQSFERPLPGASAVELRHVDVPSARFPAFWQEGLLFGYAYRMYPNNQAELAADFRQADWRIDVTCDVAAGTCAYASVGPAPASAADIAKVLGSCLLGQDVVGEAVIAPPDAVEPPAPPTAGPVAVPVAAPTPAPNDCAKAQTPQGNDIFIVQTLLTTLGADPGPADGVWGPSTQGALGQVLEQDVTADKVAEAIEPLRQMICASPD